MTETLRHGAVINNMKKVATYNLSDEVIEKLVQIQVAEIIKDGKSLSRSEILRRIILEKWEKIKT